MCKYLFSLYIFIYIYKIYHPGLVDVIYSQNVDDRTGYSLITVVYKSVRCGIRTWWFYKGKKSKLLRD